MLMLYKKKFRYTLLYFFLMLFIVFGNHLVTNLMQVWPLFFDQYLLKDVNLKTEIKKLYIFKQKIYILYIYIYIYIYIFKTYIYSNKTFESSMKLYKNQNIIITILSNDLKLLNTSQNLHCMTYDYFFKLRCFF